MGINQWLPGTFAFALVACGKPDYTVQKPDDFWDENRSELLHQIQDYKQSHQYEWIVHIHFRGNDFGAYRDMETHADFEGADRLREAYENQGQGELVPTELASSEAAISIESDFEDRRILASFVYRHSSAQRANTAFRDLFRCSEGQSKILKKTLILGSGGSHGVEELEIFSKQLEKDCGRKLDFAILSDGIDQPGPFPKSKFRGLEENGICLHFYQRTFGQLIQGMPIRECVNIKVENIAHFGDGGIARYPLQFVHRALKLFRSDEATLGF